jgi:hypothetical protein
VTAFPGSKSVGNVQLDTVGVYEHATGIPVNTVDPLPTPALTAPQALRAQIDQNGDVVVQAGNSATSPIMLFDTNGDATPIATVSGASDFSAPGRSPGISADGQIVVFSATVSAQGQTDAGVPAGDERRICKCHDERQARERADQRSCAGEWTRPLAGL